MLGISPGEYWILTPSELGELLEGATEREERALRRTAWAVAHLLNVSGKTVQRPVKVEDLLKPAQEAHGTGDKAMDFEVLWQRHLERIESAEGSGGDRNS